MADGCCCPTCGHSASGVVDSRNNALGDIPTIKRRRKCSACGAKFTTYELTEAVIRAVEDRLDTAERLRGLHPDAARAIESEKYRGRLNA